MDKVNETFKSENYDITLDICHVGGLLDRQVRQELAVVKLEHGCGNLQ